MYLADVSGLHSHHRFNGIVLASRPKLKALGSQQDVIASALEFGVANPGIGNRFVPQNWMVLFCGSGQKWIWGCVLVPRPTVTPPRLIPLKQWREFAVNLKVLPQCGGVVLIWRNLQSVVLRRKGWK